jgi:simple sugar transport system permease protein
MTLSSIARLPGMGALVSLAGIVAFYVVFGGVDVVTLGTSASWMNFAANLGIVAIPVGLLMIAGEIDISVGAMIPAGSMTVAVVSGHYELPIVLGMVAAIGLGVVVGTVNGVLTNRTSVPSLIITLGTLVAMQGVILTAANLLTGEASVAITAPDWAKIVFGQLITASHQIIILWWVAFALILGVFLHQTRIGNWIFAMGGDRISARNAGIPVGRLTIGLFILSSCSASFVGVCQAILFNSAQVSGGMGIIFNAIVSVVVGGVLLTGGYGSVFGIFVGTLTFAVVSQGIYFTQIDRNWSNLIIGIMLLLAVGMNESFRKLALSTARRPTRCGKTASVTPTPKAAR